MSTKKYVIVTERPGTHIEILTAKGKPAIIVTDDSRGNMAHFTSEQALYLALAILEAAGGDDGEEAVEVANAVRNLRRLVARQEEAAKEAADREVLTKRRDDLAHEFWEHPGGYTLAYKSTQLAIDRIIELEDRATK